MIKKLIAAVSSIAMIATMASAVVVHAADTAVIEPVLTQVSEGVYNLEVQLDVTQCAKGTRIQTLGFEVPLDTAIFDVKENGPYKVESVWSDEAFDYVDSYPNLTGVATFATLGKWNYSDNKKALIYAYVNTGASGQNLPKKMSIVTMKNLQLAAGVTTADVKITLQNVEITCGASSSDLTTYTVDNKNLTVGEVTFPGNKPAEPVEPDKPTVKDDGTILPIKPSDIGGTGDVFVGEDGSKAVAGLGNFTASGVINELNWTIKYTPVGGVETQVTKSFVPAELKGVNVESKVTIGLIVNYNPAEYENVTIVSGALN